MRNLTKQRKNMLHEKYINQGENNRKRVITNLF